MIQIFGTKKCSDTAKAIRFFKERGIKFQFINLTEKGLSKGELQSITEHIPLNNLLNIKCREYEKLNLKYMKYDIEEKLLEHPLLLMTPIVRIKKFAVTGYKPEIWEKIISTENKL
jgi:arsenate reductase-like glutaredoxin family protein